MVVDHDDQATLINALDTWFGILRERLQAPVPRKPTPASALATLGRKIGADVPPDVVALYEYSNGAWLDDDTPLWFAFLPPSIAFNALPPLGPATASWHQELAGLDMTGSAYAEFADREWEKTIPVLSCSGGEELAVVSTPRRFQAVSFVGMDGMFWVARRLADVFETAIELEEAGLLDWSGNTLEYVPGIHGFYPRSADQLGGPSPGWVWEES